MKTVRWFLIVSVVTCLLLSAAAGPTFAQARGGAEPKATVLAPVNLNTATAEQLDRLPGIGPKTAAAIIELRQKMGGFKKVEDLMSVRGIGEKTFIKLRPYVTLTPRSERPGGDQ